MSQAEVLLRWGHGIQPRRGTFHCGEGSEAAAMASRTCRGFKGHTVHREAPLQGYLAVKRLKVTVRKAVFASRLRYDRLGCWARREKCIGEECYWYHWQHLVRPSKNIPSI